MNVIRLVALTLLPLLALASECRETCRVSEQGIALIQFSEGFSPFRYKDTGGLETIGYGHLILPGEMIKEPLLGEAATKLLQADLVRTERGISTKLTAPMTQPRFDAIASFAFNVGTTACVRSTLFRYANSGEHALVPGQFMRWIYVKGKPVRGLEVRRRAEAALYQQ